MFTLTQTIKVNDIEPHLARAQIWQGLMLKASNPVPFLEAISTCEVIERGENWILHGFTLRGEETQEFVTFQPERRITFERTKGNVMDTILNETTEPKNGELGLRYMFSLVPSTLENGGAEEAKFAKHMSESCVRGVHSTLVEIRRRVAIGEIDAPQKRTLHDDRT